MTIADVLTDEFIARVACRIVSHYEVLRFRLPDADLVQLRERIKTALSEERTLTFRFIVEVRATDEYAARKRLREAFEPNPACRLPDDVRLLIPNQEITETPIPATNAVRRSLTYDVVPAVDEEAR